MEEIIKQISQLSEQGYVEIEHHESFIIAKSSENGKYYLFNSNDLKPIEGSESEQINVHDRSRILMVQNGSVNSFPITHITQDIEDLNW